LQAAIALVLGTLAGSFIVGIYPSQYVSFLAFALGFLTAVNVGFLVNLLRKEVASITGTTLPPDVSGDLERAIQNSEAIESLHNISLYSIAELVKAEPLVIYLNLPQSLGVINGWIDEALLLYYFGDACVRSLSSLYVRRFTQLLEMAIVTWPQTGAKVEGIVWASKLSPGLADEEAARIVAALRGIIGARLHNRLLGILSDKYRVVFFPAAGQTKERLGFSETA